MRRDWEDLRVGREETLHRCKVQAWEAGSAECCSHGRVLSTWRRAGVAVGLRAVFVFVSEHLCVCVCVWVRMP